MHAESVLRKQQFIDIQIRKHTVRPVNHARFHKGQIHIAQIQRLSVFDSNNFPLVMKKIF